MRASVTDLENFRLYQQDDEMTLEALLSRLRKEEPPSDAMLAGRALHSWLEHCATGPAAEAVWGDYTFKFTGDFELAMPNIREMWVQKQYGDLLVRGIVDTLDGHTIEDHKTTSQFRPERYLEGAQWKMYMDMLGAKRFRWNVFVIYEHDPKVYEVKALHKLEQVWHEGLERDCASLAKQFSEFSKKHLPERWEHT